MSGAQVTTAAYFLSALNAAAAWNASLVKSIWTSDGCTIVEINRQGYVLAGPEPSVSIFPGDRLLVLGSAESLAAARAELTQRGDTDAVTAAFDDAHLETVIAPTGSTALGQSLRALRIPHRTGAVVVGIERSGVKKPNPSGDEILEPGDRLLVIGAAEELRLLKNLLAEGAVAA